MKKLLVLLLVVCMVLTLFVACGKTAKCDLCGETKSGRTIEVLGQKAFICKDCENELKQLGSLLG